MRLEDREWIEYYIGDFFDVFRGKRIVKDVDFLREKNDEYFYPVVTAATTNNSIDGYYNKSNCPGNSIVCGGEAGGFFSTYQEEDCWVMDRSRIFKPKDNIDGIINKYIAFFLVTIFKKEMFKYSYGRSANPSHIINTIIKLPSSGDSPDWEFMEDYIKEIWNGTYSTSVRENDEEINVNVWREFRFGDLFEEIYKAKAYVKGELNISNTYIGIPFVSRTDNNNGCDCFLDGTKEDFSYEKGNAMIIGDTTSTCYYQEEDFVCGDHIVVLRAKWMNKYTALFIKTLIEKERYKYNYGRSFKMDLIKNTIIKLPVDEEGNPDWRFMEKYIKSLPFSEKI